MPDQWQTITETECRWFALCANPTTLAVSHPALGPTPICKRCATKLDMDYPEADQ